MARPKWLIGKLTSVQPMNWAVAHKISFHHVIRSVPFSSTKQMLDTA